MYYYVDVKYLFRISSLFSLCEFFLILQFSVLFALGHPSLLIFHIFGSFRRAIFLLSSNFCCCFVHTLAHTIQHIHAYCVSRSTYDTMTKILATKNEIFLFFCVFDAQPTKKKVLEKKNNNVLFFLQILYMRIPRKKNQAKMRGKKYKQKH